MPSTDRRNVAVLGSTGSIGVATLDVLRALGSPYRAWAITAHRQIDLLRQQVEEVQPDFAALTGPTESLRGKDDSISEFPEAELRKQPGQTPDHSATEPATSPAPRPASLGGSPKTRWLQGPEALIAIAEHPEVDIVVAGIVGSAGLESSLAAARAGKTLALANKESLVVAGPLLTQAVRENSARLLPIDSEHSAVFQALQAGKSPDQIERIILTASGGSLRDRPLTELDSASVEEVLAHPNWSMGRKITVDSATMMNKALEVIEARWLFDIDPAKISVVVHPQSIIHSMVEFVDGSIVAQLSPPDMRLPIQYALTYPDRFPGPAKRLDWSSNVSLDWRPADPERYPALELGFEAAKSGGTCGAVLNAANEAAVELFLGGAIRFTEIASVCRDVLHNHHFDPSPTLDELRKLDRWARQEVQRRMQLECKNLT